MDNEYIYVYASNVTKCLDKSRQIGNNIILVDQTNCRNSFLLNPLELIFKTFANTTSASSACFGLDECEVG